MELVKFWFSVTLDNPRPSYLLQSFVQDSLSCAPGSQRGTLRAPSLSSASENVQRRPRQSPGHVAQKDRVMCDGGDGIDPVAQWRPFLLFWGKGSSLNSANQKGQTQPTKKDAAFSHGHSTFS